MFKCVGHMFSVVFAINDEEIMCSTEVIPVYISVAESRIW